MVSRCKSVSICWVPSHIGILGNEMTDQEANMAAKEAAVSVNELPHKDYYPTVRKQIMDRWQVQWTNTQHNKLRNVKDTIGVWRSTSNKNRKWEVALTRLCIGHTRATHGYLMERGHHPFCEDCLVPLTVNHVLIECPSFIVERNRYLNVNIKNVTIKDVLAETDAGTFNVEEVLNFMRVINLYEKI